MVTLGRLRGKDSYTRLVAYIGMTDREAIHTIHRYWPGTQEAQSRALRGRGNQRDFWVWRLNGHRAAVFLEEILPYVRTTRVRTKIELALESQALRSDFTGYLHDVATYHALQDDYYRRMKALNWRGRKPAEQEEQS